MKIFLSYQQTWVSENDLNHNLWNIRVTLEKMWHEVFVYFFDENNEASADYIIKKVKEEIEKSNLVLAFINHKKTSEWQLLELGIAWWLWKDILLLINNKVENNYYLTYWLPRKYLLEFKDTNDINYLLTNFFK